MPPTSFAGWQIVFKNTYGLNLNLKLNYFEGICGAKFFFNGEKPPTNHDTLREPSSIIVLFSYIVYYITFITRNNITSFSHKLFECSAKRAAIVYNF